MTHTPARKRPLTQKELDALTPPCPEPRPPGVLAPGEWMPPPGEVLAPGSFQSAPQDTVDIVVANGGTTSAWVHIGNPSEVGLSVPTITSGTVTVQVAYASDGTGGGGVVNGAGTAVLVIAASTGGFNVSSNDMGAVLGYGYIRLVCGASQGADRTFKLTRKAVQTVPG